MYTDGIHCAHSAQVLPAQPAPHITNTKQHPYKIPSDLDPSVCCNIMIKIHRIYAHESFCYYLEYTYIFVCIKV